MKKIIVVICLFLLTPLAYAGTILSTNYLNILDQAGSAWQTTAMPIAYTLFFTLWLLDTTATIVFKYALSFRVGFLNLQQYVTIRLFWAAAFTVVFWSPAIYMGIINFFAMKAGVSIGSTSKLGIDPGWVLAQYQYWYDSVFTSAISSLKIYQVVLGWTYAGYNFAYLVCAIWIVKMIIELQVEIIVTVYAGGILTGFAGSQWTITWWNNYLGGVVALGVRVFVFCLLYGIFKLSLNTQTISSLDVLGSTVLIILTCLLLNKIPNQVASYVSGLTTDSMLGAAVGGAMTGMAQGAGFVQSMSKLAQAFFGSGSQGNGGNNNTNTKTPNMPTSRGGDMGGSVPKTEMSQSKNSFLKDS